MYAWIARGYFLRHEIGRAEIIVSLCQLSIECYGLPEVPDGVIEHSILVQVGLAETVMSHAVIGTYLHDPLKYQYRLIKLPVKCEAGSLLI